MSLSLPCSHVNPWPMLLYYFVSLNISQNFKMEYCVLIFPSKMQNKKWKGTVVWILLNKAHWGKKKKHVTRNVAQEKVACMVIFIRDTCRKSKG